MFGLGVRVLKGLEVSGRWGPEISAACLVVMNPVVTLYWSHLPSCLGSVRTSAVLGVFVELNPPSAQENGWGFSKACLFIVSKLA